MLITLSIIVPIYKVESYLRKCVDSLLAQDMDANEYEIILVDDGSPDACPKICDEYASQFPNIRVVHRENGGLSAARNSGLMVAKGRYVQFVDSDDYLEPNVLGELMEQIEHEDLDVLRFDYQNVRIVKTNDGDSVQCTMHNAQLDACNCEKYEVFEPNKTPRKADRRTDVVDGITYLNERMNYACYAVQFIVKRSLLLNNNQNQNEDESPSAINNQSSTILFTEGIHFEDVDWTPRMLLAAKRVNSTTQVVYDYLLREGSITKTGADLEKKKINIQHTLVVLEHLVNKYKEFPQCTWLHSMCSIMASGVLSSVAEYFYTERVLYIQQLQQLGVFPLLIANQGNTYMRRAKLINLSPRLFCMVMNMRHKLLRVKK